MQPPNKSFRSATNYKGFIDAKIPVKENSLRKKNINSHFYSARVSYVMEMAAKFHTTSVIYSVDNKNKVKLGAQIAAVDGRL